MTWRRRARGERGRRAEEQIVRVADRGLQGRGAGAEEEEEEEQEVARREQERGEEAGSPHFSRQVFFFLTEKNSCLPLSFFPSRLVDFLISDRSSIRSLCSRLRLRIAPSFILSLFCLERELRLLHLHRRPPARSREEATVEEPREKKGIDRKTKTAERRRARASSFAGRRFFFFCLFHKLCVLL